MLISVFFAGINFCRGGFTRGSDFAFLEKGIKIPSFLMI